MTATTAASHLQHGDQGLCGGGEEGGAGHQGQQHGGQLQAQDVAPGRSHGQHQDIADCGLELQTEIRTKVCNHGEGPY